MPARVCFFVFALLPHFAAAIALVTPAADAPLTLHVDCSGGSDVLGDGSASAPLASPSAARDVIRSLQPLASDVVVVITGTCVPSNPDGSHNFSLPVLTLSAVDSAPQGRSVTYTASAAVFMGGIPLDDWQTYQGPVLQTRIPPAALKAGLGSITAGNFGTCTNSASGLFFNDAPMTLARYPNVLANGSWAWLTIDSVADAGTFAFNDVDGRAKEWDASQGWLHGYWAFDWADNYVKIASIEPAANGSCTVTTSALTPPAYHFTPKARFYATNLLSELDAAGEFYIDAAQGMAYFYPPSPVASGSVFLSLAPAAIVAQSISGVSFRGVTARFFRGTAMSITNATGITVTDADLSNQGHSAISADGINITLSSIRASGLGCGGIIISGGDPASLTPSNNVVSNCSVTHYAQFNRAYHAGIHWAGVGMTITGNTISHAPHNGMLGGGNNNLFIGNTFDTLCFEVSDSGAWYAGRSWIQRGNVIMSNVFRNIRNTDGWALGWPSVQAVYLDDQLSGTIITDNLFENCMTGILLGGGRDNLVMFNHFTGNDLAVHLDNRGMNWQQSSCNSSTGALVQQLFSVNYTQPPYSTAYPAITDSLSFHPCVPVRSNVTSNTYCNTTAFQDVTQRQIDSWFCDYSLNTEKCY